MFCPKNVIIWNGLDSTFVKITYVSLLFRHYWQFYTINTFSKTGNQVETLRRHLPSHSSLMVYVRNCRVMTVVCWYILCGPHKVSVFISGLLFVCFWLGQHFKNQLSCIKLWNFGLFWKKMQSIREAYFPMAEITCIWVMVPYQQWSLIVFPEDPISLSSISVEFLGRNVAAPKKYYVSQCPLQLEIATSLFWPMGLGKVGNLITQRLLLHARYAVYTLNTYLLNE